MQYSMVSDGIVTSAGRVFAVADKTGNFRPDSFDGLYAHDTRFLSKYSLSIEDRRIQPLEAKAVDRNTATYYSIATSDGLDSPSSITVIRDRRMLEALEDQFLFINQSPDSQTCRVLIDVGADFADLFEVRRGKHKKSGQVHRETTDNGEILFNYERDHLCWITKVSCIPPPDDIGAKGRLSFNFTLPPHGSIRLEARFFPELHFDGEDREVTSRRAVEGGPRQAERLQAGMEAPLLTVPRLESMNPAVRRAYDQAVSDLRMLEIDGGKGSKVLAAGMPWFMALFGRDSIIASLQVKLLTPWFMLNTLESLADYQAVEFNAYREAEPGKIPHEIRTGELSHFGEVPHLRYYGSIDSTPLFLVLMTEAVEWINDEGFARRMLPAAEMALEWIDRHGDMNGDGFVEYHNHVGQALRNQCWKDSEDSVNFANGWLAEGPIAPVEVQGYVYHAKRGMARVYQALGMGEKSARMDQDAADLQQRFDQAFWMEDRQFYALALDGKKRQVDAISSNPGHCLWSGIVPAERARAVADRLLADDMYSGWGIRTLSRDMARYHPLSYHNGSVWPHDCSLIAAGLARYGFHEEARKVIGALLDAAAAMPDYRLPELFAGYDRDSAPFPVPYPQANAPQAWAAGAVIYCLETLMQIRIKGNQLVSNLHATSRPVTIDGIPFRGSRWRF